MEYNQAEAAVVQEAVAEAIEAQLKELANLQLAIVGGGICDTIPY
jgi:hypothetical protein